MTRTRQTRFGFLTRTRASPSLSTRFVPGAGGWTPLTDVEAPANSIESGQNFYTRGGRIEPRMRLSQLGTNTPTPDVPNGAFLYDDLGGERYPVVTSAGTVSYLDIDAWTTLDYVSGTSDIPPSGGVGDLYFGVTSYLTRRDLNLAVFTNGVDPLFAWGGPSDGTGFSTLTESPIARDITVFDDRIVGWNIRELSSASRFLTRVQWSIAGNPEDWDGVGSGFQDLLHMRGVGTRILDNGDQMVVGSTQEIWRARPTNQAFNAFAFSPITKELGMAYPRAVLQTPLGIFWLHSDYMVYRMVGEAIEPIGQPIQRTLRDTAVSLDKAFLSYNDELQQVTLFYTATTANFAQRAFTFHLAERTWTPHRYTHQLTAAFEANDSGSATTWGGLTGTLAAQNQTYNETLQSGTPDEALLSSGGTAHFLSSTESLEDGNVVTAQLQTGGIFTEDPVSVKFFDQARISLRGGSASSVSVSISDSLGATYRSLLERNVSVQSNSTQVVLDFGVSGLYHAMKFESDDTGFEIGDVMVLGRLLGEST